LHLIEQGGELIGPIQQAVVSMKVKVDELRGHEGILIYIEENEKILVLGGSPVNEHHGVVPKVRHRRSRPFAVLT
ncbi:MAG: hypothetical protein VST68_05295, partial [Nitrospirota bacterium]|nr:hypothetical protein [Nitrospirota bacterium]